jgi:hypothetical protein
MKKYWMHIVVVLLSLSCKKEQLNDCFVSIGKEITETRNLSDFDKITATSRLEVNLRQDTSIAPYVKIITGENLMEGIRTEVENGTLFLENTNVCNFVRSYKHVIRLEVNVHDLSEINLESAVRIHCLDTLVLENMRLQHYALEDVELWLDVSGETYVQSLNSGGTVLKGRSRVLKGSIEEVSNLDSRDLICKEVLLDSHTPLDCYIHAEELIYVRIYAKGNIFYAVEPSGRKETNIQIGTGQLLKLN